MHATIDKWVVSLLHKFDFIETKVEKHLSSSMLPIICKMANLVNFTYSRKLESSIWDVDTRHYILVKILMSNGGMHVATFDFIMNLNMPY
jgi:hypothetical protein